MSMLWIFMRKYHEMIHKMTRCMMQCMKCALFMKCEMRDMRVMCVMCVIKCMKYDMKWCEIRHKMTWNDAWNDVRYAMHVMQIVHFGYMQWNITLNFWSFIFDCWFLIVDCDHNLIILFLISLRIWSIGVDVKLTQQDVKNPRLQIAPPYHPFCKGAKCNEWERRAEMKWNE